VRRGGGPTPLRRAPAGSTNREQPVAFLRTRSAGRTRPILRFGVDEGERHQTLFRCAAWLTEQGAPPPLVAALLTEPGNDVGHPLESLSLVNAAMGVRRTRREQTADELRRLFVATRESERTFRGLSGEDRYVLYLVAVGTGFRANALANLTPADFDLDTATVTLAARFNESRRLNVQPLPADVSGIDLRTLQELAGHSDPILTARYSHRRLYDLAGAVEKLPNLVPTDAGSDVAEVPFA
jgi:integrase